jgi:uncharacterized protein (TIGR02145 family)
MLSLQAQDYLINFAGYGGSTTVDSVKVENLTQGTKLKMKGSDVLRLTVVTGIETIIENGSGKIGFYPNPMKDYSRMQFVLPEPGETMITLHDLSGKELVQTRDMLSKGQHTYGIQGLIEGLYIVRISSGKYSYSGRLISSAPRNTGTTLIYENTENIMVSQEKQSDSKGTNAETVMQYTTGDRLKITGISGIYSTVLMDVPSESKTLTFYFIACKDGNGNNYSVLPISGAKGTKDNLDPSGEKNFYQLWMLENLKATKYMDGTDISNIADNAAWAGRTSPAFCWYNNDTGNKDVYGALYNFYTIREGQLCPTGWHVPVDGEWTWLTDYLGGLSLSGGKLKETGLSHWMDPNTDATNEVGFTALPGGHRDNHGTFSDITTNGYWWTSSEYNSSDVVIRELSSDSGGITWETCSKQYGLSIRCIRNN